MRCIIQYVRHAAVTTKNTTKSINTGYLVFTGLGQHDSKDTLKNMSHQLLNLRTIPDKNGKINHSIKDINGDILLIPQFTLYADTSKGHRPSFNAAMSPNKAQKLFKEFVKSVAQSKLTVKTGQFGAHMDVSLTNSGPITIILEN